MHEYFTEAIDDFIALQTIAEPLCKFSEQQLLTIIYCMYASHVLNVTNISIAFKNGSTRHGFGMVWGEKSV